MRQLNKKADQGKGDHANAKEYGPISYKLLLRAQSAYYKR